MSAGDTHHNKSDRILVAIQDQHAFVRVDGRGSFRNSPPLKAFGRAAIEQGSVQFIFDMAPCQGMDSTFMGVLAGLAYRLRKQGGELVMVHLSPHLYELLSTLGLDHVMTACREKETPQEVKQLLDALPRDTLELDRSGGDRDETQRTMLEAHEALVNIFPENAPRFHDVLTFLRRDMHDPEKHTAEADETPS